MIRKFVRHLLLPSALCLVVLVLQGMAQLCAAQSLETRSLCWKSGAISDDVAAAALASGGWHCEDRIYSLEGERVLLRFEIGPETALPQYLYSRRSALSAVHVLSVDGDGGVHQSSVSASDISSAQSGGYFKVPLPGMTDKTKRVVAAFDLPSHKMTLEKAYLGPSDLPLGQGNVHSLILLAALAGMLSMPLLFNAAFYRILHEPFVLWHSMLTISLLATILVSSGLAVALFDPAAMTLSWMTTVIFGLTVAFGAMFTHSFIEADCLHPILRRALLWCAAWAVFLGVFHAAFPFVGRAVQSTLYTAAFAPIIAVFVVSLFSALRRGSRAAKFQVIGYLPMTMAGLVRLATGVVPGLHSNDAMLLFYVGCACEVLFTTLGVADRFMAIRRQRDHARFEADMLERLSERDALTGLLNRRAMDRDFETLRAEGYGTLAVLDLDHFKSINDTQGHLVGDRVLKAVAEALRSDENVQAFRLGGEEFVLLVRGKDHEAEERAERRRQAISSIVGNAVPGLGKPVTASMGMIHAGADVGLGFAELYESADKLLYDAKQAGRNRTISASMRNAGSDGLAGVDVTGTHRLATGNPISPAQIAS